MKSRITPKSLVGVGALSLLVVLTLLCLAAFGVLSLSSAKADESMSLKNASFVEQRTDTDAKCEERLSEIYGELKKAAREAADEESYFRLLSERLGAKYDVLTRTLSFEEPINDTLFYSVRLSISYNEPFYEVTEWNISVKESDVMEEQSIKLWDGEGFSLD